jgi:RNA polymerase sigma factor (sigma-70 family)
MKQPLAPELRIGERKNQEEALRKKEAELGISAAQGRKEEFFAQITPLLGPLKDYIKRRLRIAYLTLQIRTPIYTTGDILDQVTFTAYENYRHKPPDLTLEQWLYQIANEKLDKYIHGSERREARRRSLEGLTKGELRTLDEIPFTADAEGEFLLPEDLDDISYHQRDFVPPGYEDNPEQEIERKEQITRILHALSRISARDRTVFELFVIEGFSKEAVARNTQLSPDQVPRIAEKVKQHVLDQIQQPDSRQHDERKAS